MLTPRRSAAPNAECGVHLAGHELQSFFDEPAIVVRPRVAFGAHDVLDIAPAAGDTRGAAGRIDGEDAAAALRVVVAVALGAKLVGYDESARCLGLLEQAGGDFTRARVGLKRIVAAEIGDLHLAVDPSPVDFHGWAAVVDGDWWSERAHMPTPFA